MKKKMKKQPRINISGYDLSETQFMILLALQTNPQSQLNTADISKITEIPNLVKIGRNLAILEKHELTEESIRDPGVGVQFWRISELGSEVAIEAIKEGISLKGIPKKIIKTPEKPSEKGNTVKLPKNAKLKKVSISAAGVNINIEFE